MYVPTTTAPPENCESVENSGEKRRHFSSNRMEKVFATGNRPKNIIDVVNHLRVNHPKVHKGPKLIDPPELSLPKGKKRERARRQHNAAKPYRTKKSYIPPKTKKLGLDQYGNRPHRSDRPFGFDGHGDHVGFNHYDRFEQEWSDRERRIKKEEIDSGFSTQVTQDNIKLGFSPFSHFPDSCTSQQVPKIKQEVLEDSDSKQNIMEFPPSVSNFEDIFNYSVLDIKPGCGAGESNLKPDLRICMQNLVKH